MTAGKTGAGAAHTLAGPRDDQPAVWSPGDLWLALGLGLLTAISRWPYRTTMLSSWDAGLFAQALSNYNVVAHHPQPPGYIFYVAVAKALHALTGWSANTTYVAISIAAASLTIAALYLLGTLMFDRLTGVLSASLALTSVTFWLFSEITYPYTTLALGSTVLALLAWLLLHQRLARPWLAALAFGLISGFRQDLLLFLGPLFVTCFVAGAGVRSRAAWRQLVLAALAGMGGIASWWIATDLASAGWGSLWRALAVQSANVEQGTSAFATGLGALRANGTLLLWFSKDALHLAVFPALAYFALWLTQPRAEGRRPVFLLLWIAPAVAFYLLVHIGEAGYVFSFLPAVLVAAGAGISRAATAVVENLPAAFHRPPTARNVRTAIATLLALLIVPYHAWLFTGSGRLNSAERLACRDRAIGEAIATVRRDFSPTSTQLLTSAYLQQIAVYLPEYSQVHFLAPDRDTRWTAPGGVDQVVLFDLEIRIDRADPWTVLPLACQRYALAVVPASGTTFSYEAKPNRVRVQR